MEQPHRQLNWELLSAHRGTLSGIATLLVLFHHLCSDAFYYPLDDRSLTCLKIFYHCFKPTGVPVFLFLSGIGLFFSMENHPNLLRFYRKRAVTTLIPYALWGIVFWVIADVLIRHAGVGRFLSDYFLLTFFTRGDRSFWFIATIVLCYLVYPLLFYLFGQKNRARSFWLISVLLLSVLTCIFLKTSHYGFYRRVEVGLLRVFIWIMGVWCGEKVYYRKPFHKAEYVLLLLPVLIKLAAAAFYITKKSDFVTFRPVTDFYSVSLLMLGTLLLSRHRKIRACKCLNVIGKYSLELYLTHVSIWNLLCYEKLHSPLIFLGSLVISVFLSILLKKISMQLQKLLFND